MREENFRGFQRSCAEGTCFDQNNIFNIEGANIMFQQQLQSIVKKLASFPGWLIFRLIIFLTVLLLCTGASSLLAANSYQHPRGYFTVPVPEGWQTKSDGPSISLSRGNFFVTILVVENNTDASAIARQIEGQYAQQWRNFSAGPGGEFPLGNLTGGSFKLYRGINPSGIQAKLEMVAAADASRTYVVLLSGPGQAWDDYNSDWHEILYGFEVCGAPDSKCSLPAATPTPSSKSNFPATSQYPSANRAILGVQVRDITPIDLGTNGLTMMQGVLVTQVMPGGPAAQAGIQPGDVIGSIDNYPLRNSPELIQTMGNYSPGDQVTLTIMRAGRPQSVQVRLVGAANSAR